MNHDLEMKNNQLQLFMNSSPDFYYLKDLNLRHLMHNSPLPAYVDSGVENLAGFTDADFFPADRAQDIRKADLEVLSTGRMVVQKQEINDRIFEIRRIPVIMKKEVNGIAGLVRDITEQIKKESLITDLLVEKEQLLREVHHRIKNHMYTISSILSLQSAEFSDPTVIAAFDETRRRIRLMQSIYEKLYTGRDTGTIELRGYLNELLDDLRSAFCKNGRIVLTGDLREMHLSANIAFAVGIVINELITNSLKHAFVPEEKGWISILLRGIPTSTIEIVVSDDGAGAPPEVLDGTRSGFGLTLVKGYTRQFGGSMKMENSEGLVVTVTLRTYNPET